MSQETNIHIEMVAYVEESSKLLCIFTQNVCTLSEQSWEEMSSVTV